MRLDHAKLAVLFLFAGRVRTRCTTATVEDCLLLLLDFLEGLAFGSHRCLCLLLNFAVEFLGALERKLHVSCLFLVGVVLPNLVQHFLLLLFDACDSASTAQLEEIDDGAEGGNC